MVDGGSVEALGRALWAENGVVVMACDVIPLCVGEAVLSTLHQKIRLISKLAET